MRKIRELGFAVKLDTNGYHPAMLKYILDEGLADYVAMDIKNSPEKYAVTCGVTSIRFDVIRESIDILLNSGREFEFRTTVVKEFHEAADFHAMGNLIKGAEHYYLQSFTDRDTVPFGNLHAPSKEDLQNYLAIAREYVPGAQLRGSE